MAKEVLFHSDENDVRNKIRDLASKGQFGECVEIIRANPLYFTDGVNEMIFGGGNGGFGSQRGMLECTGLIKYIVINNLFDPNQSERDGKTRGLDGKLAFMCNAFGHTVNYKEELTKRMLESCAFIARHFAIDQKTYENCMQEARKELARSNPSVHKQLEICLKELEIYYERMYNNYRAYIEVAPGEARTSVLVFPEEVNARVQALAAVAKNHIIAPGGPGWPQFVSEQRRDHVAAARPRDAERDKAVERKDGWTEGLADKRSRGKGI